MAGAVFQTWLPIVGGVVLLESTATAFKRRPLRELEQLMTWASQGRT
jgi:hypothetical protein